MSAHELRPCHWCAILVDAAGVETDGRRHCPAHPGTVPGVRGAAHEWSATVWAREDDARADLDDDDCAARDCGGCDDCAPADGGELSAAALVAGRVQHENGVSLSYYARSHDAPWHVSRLTGYGLATYLDTVRHDALTSARDTFRTWAAGGAQ